MPIIPGEGEFYVFEGLDGVGKSTAAESFAEERNSILLRTPGAGVQEIRNYVDAEIHSPQTKFLMYMGSVSAVSDQATLHVKAGNSVVVDRYYPTTVAYQNAASDRDWMPVCWQFDFLEPDRMFYLYTDEETRKNRMYGREAVGHRNETNDQFMLKVRDEYENLVEELDMTPVEAVDGVENVLSLLNEKAHQ